MKEVGQVCGIDGCDGIIKEHEPEDCSCHINPPCSACLSDRRYCPKCDWVGMDEKE